MISEWEEIEKFDDKWMGWALAFGILLVLGGTFLIGVVVGRDYAPCHIAPPASVNQPRETSYRVAK